MVHRLTNGMEIPKIGIGTFGSGRFTPEQVSEAVYGAIRAGYRLIDCASIYGNEDKIGNAFKKAFDEGTVTREGLFVISKVWNDMHGKGDVLLSCAKTLRDLKLEYLDMYLVHWPFSYSQPFCVDDFIKVWRQMEKLIYVGLVKSIGLSNMTIRKLNAVLPKCRIRPAALEMELHPAFQQPALFEYCLLKGIQPIGFSPIGAPTRPDSSKTSEDISVIEMPEIVEIAKAHKVHPATICLKWAVQRGQIPIPFSVSENEYVSNLRSIEGPSLTAEEMAQIEAADKGCRLIKGQEIIWEGAEDWRELWDGEV